MGFFSELFGSGDQTTTSSPWRPQAEHLQVGFKEAARIYDEMQGTPAYQGRLVAKMNPYQSGAISKLYNTSMGYGDKLGKNLANIGKSTAGNLNSYAANANRMFNAQSMDSTVDNTLGGAMRYADNPYMQGMIDAAISDANKVTGKRISGSEAAATATGNMNSSRMGTLEAQLVDEARDRVAEVSSSMRGDAYANGLGIAANQGQQIFANQLAANAQVGSGAQMGADFMRDGLAARYTSLDAGMKAGDRLQQQDQNVLNARFQRWQMADERPYSILDRYMRTVGGNQYGGTTTVSGGGPGIVGTALGIGSSIAGMGGKNGFGWW